MQLLPYGALPGELGVPVRASIPCEREYPVQRLGELRPLCLKKAEKAGAASGSEGDLDVSRWSKLEGLETPARRTRSEPMQ